MTIRKYKTSDFEKLYEIDRAVFTEGIAYSQLELQHYTGARNSRTLVAEDDGEIVGFVIGCAEPRKLGHIITIDVTPHRQRQHLGSLLLAEIESWLWKQGAEAIYLETPVDDSGARGFYEKHGYFLFERIAQYYNEAIDAFVMMKTDRRSYPG
ncbi:MAG TPA: GNAT family N-acetyltransferase [Blastocatellia bacterium]|nr:GNAT family N-acetyltransferase [Blastocatellia bacterium]